MALGLAMRGPKPTYLYSNYSELLQGVSLPLPNRDWEASMVQRQERCILARVTFRYTDAEGHSRVQGSSDLKATNALSFLHCNSRQANTTLHYSDGLSLTTTCGTRSMHLAVRTACFAGPHSERSDRAEASIRQCPATEPQERAIGRASAAGDQGLFRLSVQGLCAQDIQWTKHANFRPVILALLEDH